MVLFFNSTRIFLLKILSIYLLYVSFFYSWQHLFLLSTNLTLLTCTVTVIVIFVTTLSSRENKP